MAAGAAGDLGPRRRHAADRVGHRGLLGHAHDAGDRVYRLARATVRQAVPVPALEHIGERVEHGHGQPELAPERDRHLTRRAHGARADGRRTGLKMLFDEAQGTAVVLQYFETAEDMDAGGKAFSATDSSDTPGTRASVDVCELKLERHCPDPRAGGADVHGYRRTRRFMVTR